MIPLKRVQSQERLVHLILIEALSLIVVVKMVCYFIVSMNGMNVGNRKFSLAFSFYAFKIFDKHTV